MSMKPKAFAIMRSNIERLLNERFEKIFVVDGQLNIVIK